MARQKLRVKMYTNGTVREMRGKGQSSTLSQLISFIRNIIFHKDNKRISHLSPTKSSADIEDEDT